MIFLTGEIYAGLKKPAAFCIKLQGGIAAGSRRLLPAAPDAGKSAWQAKKRKNGRSRDKTKKLYKNSKKVKKDLTL